MNLTEKESKYFFQTYKRLPLIVEKGEGVFLHTDKGIFLDMFGGLAVNVLGYNNPKVNEAIVSQIYNYNHLSNNFYQETQINFAEKLLTLSGFERIFLASTGTEAMEGAIKLVRKYFHSDKKTELISFKGGFHGRTYGSLSLTTKEKYRKGFEPLLPNVHQLLYNSLHDLKNTVNENTAAVFLEFIQGEGGIYVADCVFIDTLNELKEKYGFLIIADCIQCGAGRTGKFLSIQHYKADVDICVTAKGIGGGLPVAALMAKEYLNDCFKMGEHGTTFGGNPVACAAGIATLEEIESYAMRNAEVVGAYLKNEIINLQKKYPDKIKEVRGMGLMLGIELGDIVSAKVVENLFERKVLVNLTNDNCIRLLPPLILSQEEADIFLKAFEESLL
ncbi:MAG: aminotransferase class III-fold pyridoxal phosphate-dependent enzyme [Ignavibacteria bacterium]|nr:aminotransferase class III-fold pyridoxal phosphate-dependent enzyme [Ignavibacteria bacterium]